MFRSIRFRAIFFTALFWAAMLITARAYQVLFTRSIVTSAFEDQIQSRFNLLYTILEITPPYGSNVAENSKGLAHPFPLVKQLPQEVLEGRIANYPTHFFWGILDEKGSLTFKQFLPGDLPFQSFQSDNEKKWWTGTLGNANCMILHRKLPSGDTLFLGSPLTDLTYTLQYFIYMNIFFGFLMITLITLGLWIIFGQIFKPLQKISNIAEKIGSGLISTRIVIHEIDKELKPVALSLNSMLDRLEQNIEAHARFNSEVSHEILNPLNSVTTLLNQSLGYAKEGRDLTPNLLECQSAVLKTTNLAGDLLELARSESISTHTHIRIDLEPVIDQAVVDAKRLATEKGINIELKSSTVGVQGNPSQIYQVVFNLLTNAIKFAPQNSTIRVTLAKTKQEAEISVYDCGPGVNPTETGNLFKRFFRTHSARYHQTMGYGLGLAICKNIIDQHKGIIGYERTYETETRFYFTLPLQGT